MLRKIFALAAMASLFSLPLAAAANSVNKSVRIADGAVSDGASSVNGSVSVGSGATVNGEVKTVNGTIRVDANAIVQDVSTVNGAIRIGEGVQATSAKTVNGSLRIGDNSRISGPVAAVNGRIELGRMSHVDGNVGNVNGEIVLDAAVVESDIETVNGDVLLENGAVVNGDIHIEKPNFSWIPGKKNRRKPKIIIGADSRVNGQIVAEREIELYIHETAIVESVDGRVSMDDAVRFSGNRP